MFFGGGWGGYVVKGGVDSGAGDYSHTRLRSLGEGGCSVGDLPVNEGVSAERMRMRNSCGLVMGYLTGRGTRRLGDWISGTRDAAA